MNAATYGINLERVINSHSAWSLNKLLATKLSIHPHFTVGEFFKSMSNEDIDFLSKQIAETTYEDDAAAELFLMMMLLCIAEGVDNDEESMDSRFDALIMFVTCESLARKGLAEVMHENMSFGDDMKHANLARATDAGMDFMAGVLGDEPDAG